MSEGAITEFLIEVRKGGDVVARHRGQRVGEHAIQLEGGKLETRTVDALVEMMRDRRLKLDELKLMGEHLYHTLLGEEIGGALHSAITKAREGLVRLRVTFDPETDRYAAFPWEYLYLPLEGGKSRTGYFLATKAKIVLSRYLDLQQVGEADSISMRVAKVKELCVLLVIANPARPPGAPEDKRKLWPPVFCQSFVEELRELCIESLRMRRDQDEDQPTRVRLVQLGLPADAGEDDRERLRTKLEEAKVPEDKIKIVGTQATWQRFLTFVATETPHVIHFIGHGQHEGGKSSLIFLKENGWEADPRNEEVFAEQVIEPGSLKLVFLQACESGRSDPYHALAGLGLRLSHNNVPVVIGMQTVVDQSVANDFAAEVYRGIVQKADIDTAVAEARKKISHFTADEERSQGFGIPVLYRQAADAILEIEPETQAAGAAVGSRRDHAGSQPEDDFRCRWCQRLQFREAIFCGDCRRPLRCGKCNNPVRGPKRGCIYCAAEVLTAEQWEEYRQKRREEAEEPHKPAAARAQAEAAGGAARSKVVDIRVQKK